MVPVSGAGGTMKGAHLGGSSGAKSRRLGVERNALSSTSYETT